MYRETHRRECRRSGKLVQVLRLVDYGGSTITWPYIQGCGVQM
jgi:hypothetical protein